MIPAGPVWEGPLNRWFDAQQEDHRGLRRLLDLGQSVRMAATLIHEIQRERGLSSGFVAGSGERFPTALEDQRRRTDGARRLAEELWGQGDEDRPGEGLGDRLTQVRGALDSLEALRTRVSELTIPTASTFSQYTSIIEQLLLIIVEAPGASPHPRLTLALIGLFHFVLAKEYAGRERALGSILCVQGDQEPHVMASWSSVRRRKGEALSIFQRHAAQDQWLDWRKTVETPAFDRFERIAGDLEAYCQDPGRRRPDPEVWFQAATRAIDSFRVFEGRLLDDLDHQGAALLAEARAEVPAYSNASTDPEVRALVLAELGRLEAALDEARGLGPRCRVLHLDTRIEAVSRADLARSAEELHAALESDLDTLARRTAELRAAVDRLFQQSPVPKESPL